MSDEELKDLIAVALNWRIIPWADGRNKSYVNPEGYYCNCPNYPGDLDAMHEVESKHVYTDHDTYVRYENHLIDLTEHPLHATARQKAEAFALTLGLTQP